MSRTSLFQVFFPRQEDRISGASAGPRSPRKALLGGSLAMLLALGLAPGCRVHSGSRPPHISGTGLLRGHVALGIRDEDQLLRFRVSISPDSLVEFSLWKLLRFEVGLVGASVGVGPIDVGIGALFYDPDIPIMQGWDDDDESMTEQESIEENSDEEDWDQDEEWNGEIHADDGGSSWRQVDSRPDKIMQGL